MIDVTSICIFGSAARKDQDDLSDKDVLILYNGSDECKRQIDRWTSQGWSVASYSPARLKKMANAGSLFIQHLKQEGVILADPTDELRSILYSYQPAFDYSLEIAESISSLCLLEHVPVLHELDYWSADVLHVLLRNLGILRLANEGIYEFSFIGIAQKLVQLQYLSIEDVEVFSSLRFAKSAYRSRRLPAHSVDRIVESGLRVMEKLFGVALERQQSLILENPNHSQAYFNLRAIEKILISLNGLPGSDASNLVLSEKVLWKTILNPRAYAWNIKTEQSNLWSHLKDAISSETNLNLSVGSECNLAILKSVIKPLTF